MNLYKSRLWATSVLLCASVSLQASDLYVDANRLDDAGDGLSWNTAKRSIQSAIDTAPPGSTIWVTNGVYEPIITDNQTLVIQSVSGPRVTLIDGHAAMRCATLGFAASHTNTILAGFTLRNGRATASWWTPEHPYDIPDYGGGSICGTLLRCILTSNKGATGGGAQYGVLNNCIISDNTTTMPMYGGGGAAQATLNNCTVENNVALQGGGTYLCTLRNCIVRKNKSLNSSENNCVGGTFEYCCSTPLLPGNGNTDADPFFLDESRGDFRLCRGSPCQNSGTNAYVVGALDIEGEARIQEGVVDMGAYEGVIESHTISVRVIGAGALSPSGTHFNVESGSNVYFRALAGPRTFLMFLTNGVEASSSPDFTWSAIRADGELTAVFSGLYVDAAKPDDAGDGLSWITAKRSIQAAINSSLDHEIVWVTNGLYSPITCINKPISIQSINGPGSTVIDGGLKSQCARLGTLASQTNTVLAGFTLQNGYRYSNCGGGASGGTLVHCFLYENQSDANGGGAYCSTLIDCVIANNRAHSSGGGVHGGRLVNCTVVGNTAYNSGGGIHSASAVNCILWGNMISQSGLTNNYQESSLTHSCAVPAAAGEGNIDLDPLFLDTSADAYQLRDHSPCIDAGTNAAVLSSADYHGRPRIQHGRVDMGAFERSAEFMLLTLKALGRGQISPSGVQQIPTGQPITCVATPTGAEFCHFVTNGAVATAEETLVLPPLLSDMTVEAVFAPDTYYADAARPNDDGDGRCWATAKRTIQAAIDAAAEGDTIWVTNGCYTSISTANKKVSAQSVNGASSTVIDGGGTNRCASLGYTHQHVASTLEGFTLENGSAPVLLSYGGGSCWGTLTRCIIRNNRAKYGAGTYFSVAKNCVLIGNLSSENDTGSEHGGSLTSCTLWDDDGYDIVARNCILGGSVWWFYDNTCTIQYSCAAQLFWPGTGNISAEPMFVAPSIGDFRLRKGSPCVDKGSAEFASGTTDFFGNPRVLGKGVDMGAIEGSVDVVVLTVSSRGHGTVSPSGVLVMGPGSNVLFTATATGIGFSHFLTNGVFATTAPELLIPNVRQDMSIQAFFVPETKYVDATRPDDAGDGQSWATAKQTIQAAIDAACDDDVICVTNGTYAPFSTINSLITIQSVNGAGETIIDGHGSNRCATLDRNCTIDGFTLTGGRDSMGGGALYGTLRRCRLLNNTATSYGGGAFMATLEDCVFSNNASRAGGGSFDCLLTNCALLDNVATSTGGGDDDGTLYNCILVGNRAPTGGGAYRSRLRNCTVTKNAADLSGGGYYADYEFYTIANCIVWANTLTNGTTSDCSGGGSVLYTCASSLPAVNGNIASNPQFAQPETGNYQLSLASPCINSGTNALAAGESDFKGSPRIQGGRVDMGAYEQFAVEQPQFLPGSGTAFIDKLTVSITCGTSNAVIRFTVDGSTPSSSSRAYVAPLLLSSTTLVKAAAYRDGYVPSAVSDATFTKAPFSDAVDVTGVPLTTGGNAGWFGETNVTHDGTDAAQSGPISDGGLSWMETSANGPCLFSFWWKVSCEDDPVGDNWDFLRLLVDGTEHARMDGESDWQKRTISLTNGIHTLRWEYCKDSVFSSGADAGWVDELHQQTSTATTPIAIPFSWISLFSTITAQWGDDFEGATSADSDRDGMLTWEEYLAGTDPTNASSVFRTVISPKDILPNIHWSPDLTNAMPKRTYYIYGSTNLLEPFRSAPLTNLPAGTPIPIDRLTPYHFFKAGVSLE